MAWLGAWRRAAGGFKRVWAVLRIITYYYGGTKIPSRVLECGWWPLGARRPKTPLRDWLDSLDSVFLSFTVSIFDLSTTTPCIQ